MAQEQRKCSSGSCGGAGGSGGGGGGGRAWSAGRSTKKQKQKKPPQRGLGVAQLERLRLEEQRRKDPASFYPSPPTFNSFSPSASVLRPNFRVESGLKPWSSSLVMNIPSVPNMDAVALGPVALLNMKNYNDYDVEMTRRLMDLPKMNDHPPLLANASSSDTMPQPIYQLEPPSNQSHPANVAPFRPPEEKVPSGGMKRSCPFSLENLPAPYVPFKIHKVGNPITNRPEEPSSFSGIDNLRENFGEGPSRSSSMLESSSTDSVKENKVLDGGYLTLGPPVDNTPRSQRFASCAKRRHNPYPAFELPQYPGYPVGFVYRHPLGRTDQLPQPQFQRPYYNFLPTPANESSKDTLESIDLNLKL